MKNVFNKVLMIGLLASSMTLQAGWGDDDVMLERIDRLERIVKGQGMVSLLGRIDQLQNEVQRLNGDNEALKHQLETMKLSQREMYIELDSRLQSPSLGMSEKQSLEMATLKPATTKSGDMLIGSQSKIDGATQPTEVPPVDIAAQNGEETYQAALQTLRGGQYKEAIATLSLFPQQYPKSTYLPNAYYWQGEANYVLRNFEAAIINFQAVIDKFPVSSKVADAVLKQGFSQYELGRVDIATANLKKVIDDYPTTSAARLAKVRLERIQKEAN